MVHAIGIDQQHGAAVLLDAQVQALFGLALLAQVTEIAGGQARLGTI